MENSICIGLDFGTSTCQLSVCAPDRAVRRPLPIHKDKLNTFIPSIAFYTCENKLLIGEDAENAIRSGQKGLILPSAKRYIRFSDIYNPVSLDPWPVKTPSPYDVMKVFIGEILTRGENLLISRNVVNSHEDFVNLELHLSCMVDSDFAWRNKLLNCCRDWGMKNINVNSIVEESICAGLAYMATLGTIEGEYLVYDFGGGSFDAAWIKTTYNKNGELSYHVYAFEGDSLLGGDDIDKGVVDLIKSKLSFLLNVNIDSFLYQNPVVAAEIRLAARECKEKLSLEDEVKITAVQLQIANTVNNSEYIIITKIELIEIMRNIVYRSIEITQLMITQVASVTSRNWTQVKNSCKGILLSGGISKIPYVQQQLLNILNTTQIIQPSIFGYQDCVSIGCSRPLNYGHSNLRYRSYAVYLLFNNDNECIIANPFDEAFNWFSILLNQNKEFSVSIPNGTLSVKIKYKDINDNEFQCQSYYLNGTIVDAIYNPKTSLIIKFDANGDLSICNGNVEYFVISSPWRSEQEINDRIKLFNAEYSERTNDRNLIIDKINSRPWIDD
jgi:hypothetical protein